MDGESNSSVEAQRIQHQVTPNHGITYDVIPLKVLDTTVKEDGKRYFQIRWMDSWIEEVQLAERNCSHLIISYWEESKKHLSFDESQINKNSLIKIQGSDETRIERTTPDVKFNSPMIPQKFDSFKQKGKDSVSCNVCMQVLSSKKALKRHSILKHLKNGRFQCKQCERRFSSATELNRHSTVHSNIKKHLCKECGKAFKQPGQLLNHKRRCHEENRNFSCEDCGQKFHQRYLLNYHMSTHNESKEFSCMLCEKKFKNKCNLYAHVRNFHSMKLHEVCNICAKGFTDTVILASHLKESHELDTFQCSKCEELYFARNSFLEHYISNSCVSTTSQHCVNKLKCAKCELFFPSIHYLNNHFKKHTFSCYVCKKSFKLPQNLKTHYQREHGLDLPILQIIPTKEKNSTCAANIKEHSNMIEDESKLKLPTVSTLISKSETMKCPSKLQSKNLTSNVVSKQFHHDQNKSTTGDPLSTEGNHTSLMQPLIYKTSNDKQNDEPKRNLIPDVLMFSEKKTTIVPETDPGNCDIDFNATTKFYHKDSSTRSKSRSQVINQAQSNLLLKQSKDISIHNIFSTESLAMDNNSQNLFDAVINKKKESASHEKKQDKTSILKNEKPYSKLNIEVNKEPIKPQTDTSKLLTKTLDPSNGKHVENPLIENNSQNILMTDKKISSVHKKIKKKKFDDKFYFDKNNLLNCKNLMCVTCGTSHQSQIELMCHLMSKHKSELMNIQEKPLSS